MSQNELIPPPNQKKGPLPKWACPKCGGTDVQILLPAWYYETEDGTLTHICADEVADVELWYCEECLEIGSGVPIYRREARADV